MTFAVTPAGSLRRLPGDRSRHDLHPWTVVGRLLTCTACGAHVDLVEIPEPWIDERSYVCGPCMQPVEATRPDYDPRTSPWPEGF